MNTISKSTLDFLKELRQNNNREWFAENKSTFEAEQKKVKAFYIVVMERLKVSDLIESVKIFRIYRDVRFSKNKLPFKSHFGGQFTRATNKLRGGYYLHICPGDSFLAGGFWEPNKEDLARIRKEFEEDATEIREIINTANFKKHFGTLQGEAVKSAPRGFDKNHPNIDLIKLKQFIVSRTFTDDEVLAPNFLTEVVASFEAMRPYLDYMSDVLTTDLNGISLVD
ncbi:MAG: DUF2461 domain-containing protein [Lutibacter sp.]